MSMANLHCLKTIKRLLLLIDHSSRLGGQTIWLSFALKIETAPKKDNGFLLLQKVKVFEATFRSSFLRPPEHEENF